MFTRAFWVDAGERALKTLAQAMLTVLTSGAFGIVDADWGSAASIGGLAAVVSVLTSIMSASRGTPGTASLVNQPNPKE